MTFNGKVVLVTGASSGIGAAIAIGFAKEEADVAMVGRNETKLAAVEEICASHGKPPLVIKADVTKDDDVRRIIETIVEKYGKLDIMVNNAGIGRLGTITDGKLMEAYDEVIATNLRAPMQLTLTASPHLIKTKGNIINISSTLGSFHASNLLPFISYGVSKAALNNFTMGSALELSAHGVRVNVVSPGPVFTDILENSKCDDWGNYDILKTFTLLNRVSEPNEVTDLVLFLASDKARGITGANYVSDNGMFLKR